MKRYLKRIFVIFLIAFTFLATNFILPIGPGGITGYKGKNIVYASPKGFGGFKSGGFKSKGFKSGGFKSGIFKSSGSKSKGFNFGGSSSSSSKNKSYSSGRTSRSFIPFFIPWGFGGGSIGHGIFSLGRFIFNLVLIIIIIIVILRIIKRRR